jgi:hypothetical protein
MSAGDTDWRNEWTNNHAKDTRVAEERDKSCHHGPDSQRWGAITSRIRWRPQICKSTGTSVLSHQLFLFLSPPHATTVHTSNLSSRLLPHSHLHLYGFAYSIRILQASADGKRPNFNNASPDVQHEVGALDAHYMRSVWNLEDEKWGDVCCR